MTFLGLERPVEYQRLLIFDPTTANMVLNAQSDYVNAVYNDYLRGLEDMKEFNKTYGDFMSPIQKDMDWYNKNVTGKVRDFIANAYAQGIDPLRSAEGRAAVSLLIYSMPTGDIAKVRLSAEAAKEYIKNRGALEAAGKWDPDFERFANQGNMLEDWDTINGGNGVWTRTSPAELKSLKDLTESWYNNRQAHMLDKAGVESFNMKYDPRYDYTGFTELDLLDIASGQTPGWNGTIYSDYYRDVARRLLLAMGNNNPTAKDIEAQLQRNVAIANKEWKIAPQKVANQFALDDYRTANDIRAHAANAATDYKYKIKEATDPRLGGGGAGRNKTKFNPNIFREAEALVPKMSAAHHPWGTKAGEHVGYIPSGQYGELIDPILPAAYRQAKDKDSGQIIEKYVFNKPTIKDRIYTIDEYGNVLKSLIQSDNNNTAYSFVPDGQIKAARAGNGYRYYISGQIRGNHSDSFAVNKEDGSTLVWIEVKERGYVYDGK